MIDKILAVVGCEGYCSVAVIRDGFNVIINSDAWINSNKSRGFDVFSIFGIFKINSNAKVWKILMFPNIFVTNFENIL